MSFPLVYISVVAPVAPDLIAASLSSHPYFTFLAIFGTRTAQSLSPMVRSLMDMSATSMWTDFLNSVPASVRRIPLLPMVIML